MRTAEERIRELAKNQAIDDADAAALLGAVGAPSALRGLPLWKDPFARFSGEALSVVGLVVAALGVLVTRLSVRFDGAFDVHTSRAVPTLARALVEQVAAFPLVALVFWLVARVRARGTRFVDLLGTVGLSRLPPTLLAVPLGLAVRASGDGELHGPAVILVALVLFGSGLQFFWLYQGFRTARGRHLPSHGWPLVVAVVASEVVSQLVLRALPDTL